MNFFFFFPFKKKKVLFREIIYISRNDDTLQLMNFDRMNIDNELCGKIQEFETSRYLKHL